MSTNNSELPRFDLALTMAGAVSAGAYTAGVIDFLIQALDAWEESKSENDPMAPKHTVCLRAISGASAGAITAAILGATIKYDYPHYRLGDIGDGSSNPLYDSWVNMIDISYLLQNRDLEKGVLPNSVLDSTSLLEIARKAINYGDGVSHKRRPYLSDPLRFIFTLTNLRGVPFVTPFNGTQYFHSMIMHGDTMRFALTNLHNDAIHASPRRSNEYELIFPSKAEKWGGTWKQFAIAALASGAERFLEIFHKNQIGKA